MGCRQQRKGVAVGYNKYTVPMTVVTWQLQILHMGCRQLIRGSVDLYTQTYTEESRLTKTNLDQSFF